MSEHREMLCLPIFTSTAPDSRCQRKSRLLWIVDGIDFFFLFLFLFLEIVAVLR